MTRFRCLTSLYVVSLVNDMQIRKCKNVEIPIKQDFPKPTQQEKTIFSNRKNWFSKYIKSRKLV